MRLIFPHRRRHRAGLVLSRAIITWGAPLAAAAALAADARLESIELAVEVRGQREQIERLEGLNRGMVETLQEIRSAVGRFERQLDWRQVEAQRARSSYLDSLSTIQADGESSRLDGPQAGPAAPLRLNP